MCNSAGISCFVIVIWFVRNFQNVANPGSILINNFSALFPLLDSNFVLNRCLSLVSTTSEAIRHNILLSQIEK